MAINNTCLTPPSLFSTPPPPKHTHPGGEEGRDIFERAMKTVDVTFQNLDSSEISLTDVSHYFDSDPTKLVASLRGDGKTPSAYIADTTTANAQVGGGGCWVADAGGG